MDESSVSVVLHLQKGAQNKILPRIKLRATGEGTVLLQTTRMPELRNMVVDFCEAIGLDMIAISESDHATELVVSHDSIRSLLEALLSGELTISYFAGEKRHDQN